MENKHQYEANVEWTEDRKGIISSPVLNQKIEVATPPDFPKGEPNIWSSEHLFVAAISSCLMNTFFAIAENSDLNYEGFECNAIGIVEKIDDKYLVTEVNLKPILTISDKADSDKALRVLDMTQKSCIISNSVTSKVLMYPKIVVTT
jgi:organic hydroperoxide reductase OsmC/OhrA